MLQNLLRRLSADAFLKRYYLLLPHSEPGACAHLTTLVRSVRLAELLAAPGADVTFARDGAYVPVEDPAREAVSRIAEGCTVVVKHAERHCNDLAALAHEFETDLGAPVDVHWLQSPAAGSGYGWHCDVEEVFILQLAGSKSYRLRKNTVHPWPLRETIAGAPYEREGSTIELDCRLDAGDWLYLPAGWWHAARALDASVSLSVGLSPPTGLDVVGRALEALRSSPVWRQRIPPVAVLGASREQRLATLRESLMLLTEDLRRFMGEDAWLEGLLAGRGAESPAPSAVP